MAKRNVKDFKKALNITKNAYLPKFNVFYKQRDYSWRVIRELVAQHYPTLHAENIGQDEENEKAQIMLDYAVKYGLSSVVFMHNFLTYHTQDDVTIVIDGESIPQKVINNPKLLLDAKFGLKLFGVVDYLKAYREYLVWKNDEDTMKELDLFVDEFMTPKFMELVNKRYSQFLVINDEQFIRSLDQFNFTSLNRVVKSNPLYSQDDKIFSKIFSIIAEEIPWVVRDAKSAAPDYEAIREEFSEDAI